MSISRTNIAEYVKWDEFNNRYELTSKAYTEQTHDDVRAVIETVLRSWFIPSLTPIIQRWFKPIPEQVKPEQQLSLW